MIPFVMSSLTSCVRGQQFIGLGTEHNPYLITNRDDMIKLESIFLNNAKEYQRSYFKVTADIDMHSTHFRPMGTRTFPFYGHFDGNGHKISHISIESVMDNGFIGYLGTGGSVSNLTLDYICDDDPGCLNFGGVVGTMEKGTKVTNCTFLGSILSEYETPSSSILSTRVYNRKLKTNYMSGTATHAIGGIAGLSYGEISNCTVKTTIKGGICGGIAGDNRGIIKNCKVVDSTISGHATAGSFVGFMYNKNGDENKLTVCEASNITIHSKDFFGSMVGVSYGKVEISNCLAYGTNYHDPNEAVVTYTIGDLIGGVLYESGLSEEEEATNKANSVNLNELNLHHNLSSFDHSITNHNRKMRLHFPYATEGATLTNSHNISVNRIKKDEFEYSFDINLASGYDYYLSDDSQVEVSGALSASALSISLVASTIEKDPNFIEVVDINGFTGYKY